MYCFIFQIAPSSVFHNGTDIVYTVWAPTTATNQIQFDTNSTLYYYYFKCHFIFNPSIMASRKCK